MHHHHAQHLTMFVGQNPLEIASLIGVFSFSFFASLHCAFMCSPIVCAQLGKRATISHSGLWLYNLGRLLSYTFLGALVAALQSSIVQYSKSVGIWISTLLGFMIIGAAVAVILGDKLPSIKVGNVGRWLPLVHRFPTVLKDFSLGLLTVFLPCATLTPALMAAAATGSFFQGGVIMFTFAFGTLPIMLSATYVPSLVFRKFPKKRLRWPIAFFLLVVGIMTLIRSFHV